MTTDKDAESQHPDAFSPLDIFSGSSVATRIFLWLRWKLTPYKEIAATLPRQGALLDLGCGHGLLSLTLAQESPGRRITAVDHDRSRIDLARSAANRIGVSQITFEVGNVVDTVGTVPDKSLAGVAMIDILHYFDEATQRRLIAEAGRVLRAGGILAVREVDPDGGIAARWNRLYENLATRIGFTRSASQSLEFRRAGEWEGLIARAGFRVRSARCGSRIFSDILFIGQRED